MDRLSSPRLAAARSLVVLALLVAVIVGLEATPAGGAPAPPPMRADPGEWVLPVDGRVVRGFDAPTRFGPGHRGVDLAAAPGTHVRAAGLGRVVFAGTVAGSLHVTVAHAGGLRTSYSFLATVGVSRGESVAAGRMLGTTGGVAHGGRSVPHVGLRIGTDYVDPMRLFERVVPASVVRLVPVDLRPPPDVPGPPELPDPPELPEAAVPVAPELPEVGTDGWPEWLRALRELDHDRGLVVVLADAAAGGLRSGARAAGRAVVEPIDRLGGAVERAELAVDGVATAGRTLSELQGAGIRAARRALTEECTDDAAPADGTGGSGNAVMVVAGIDSSSRDGSAPVGIPTDLLGYRPEEVGYFSYANGDGYAREDTWGDVVAAAERLGAQLRARARHEPGRAVDLLAHSLGGVVVRTFLQLVYDPTDVGYPPLAHVVTLSSPHEGAPAAEAGEWLTATRVGSRVAELASELAPIPPADAPAARQVAEGSDLMRLLDATRLPGEIEFTTIGAVDDVVVPADRISVPGATEVVVNPAGADDHSGIVDDPGAMREVRLALEGRRPACRSFLAHLRAELEPIAITSVEEGVGRAAAAAGVAADAATEAGAVGP